MKNSLLNRINELSIEELYNELYLDPLTNILNRRAFEILSQDGVFSCIAIIDLDGLKYINDELGHREGDNELIHLADHLSEINEMVFRISGDEFVIMSEDLDEKELEDTLLDFQKITNKFSFGVADDLQSADKRLILNKKLREINGDRAKRGEKPVWLKDKLKVKF